MIDKELYIEISKKYGNCASWAIWAEQGLTPKSNVGDLSIFDLNIHPDMTDHLRTNIIMVGLNISRSLKDNFGNFHDRSSQSQDFKLRYAFEGTEFYGAYMTDIIKDFENKVAGKVNSYLKQHPEFETQNIEKFKTELNDIKSQNPVLIAFGNDTFNILDRHFKSEYQIVKVPHYSIQMSKENYRKIVGQILKDHFLK